MKFGVGQPVRRFEDQTLITGKGRYTDDMHFDKAAQAYVVRARVAHANIRNIDTAAAKKMPGVLLVLTGDDVKADGLGDVRYCTGSMSMPAVCLNSSADMCCVAPKPGLATVSLPGLCFASATSSFALFAGKSGRATMIRLAVATCPIGSNAIAVS